MINSKSIKKIFGNNLRKLRLAKEITQEQLAEMLDMQVQSITFIENGRTFVSSEVIAKICNFFDVSLEVMFRPKFLEQTGKAENLKKEIDQTLTKYRNILFTLKN